MIDGWEIEPLKTRVGVLTYDLREKSCRVYFATHLVKSFEDGDADHGTTYLFAYLTLDGIRVIEGRHRIECVGGPMNELKLHVGFLELNLNIESIPVLDHEGKPFDWEPYLPKRRRER